MKNTNEKIRYLLKQKGITLIALIITILVILILITISMSLLTGENGILAKAREAREKHDVASIEEQNKLDIYNDILNSDSTTSRGDVIAIGDKNKLNCTITNMTGTTFKINVNAVDAATANTMYYFVNNNLVYQGTDNSYTVTGLNENTQYEVSVLADKNDLKVTTGTGDSVSSWLACIGESRPLSLEEVISDNQLFNNLMSSTDANDYLFRSTQIILPAILNNQTYCNKVMSNTNSAKVFIENTIPMGMICSSSVARLSMYDNYMITEPIIANSVAAQNIMKASTQYQVVNVTPANSSTVFSTAYNNKAFVFQTWNYNNSSYTDYRYHGDYQNGGILSLQTSAGITQYITVNKFAKTIISGYKGYSAQVCYTSIFKI